MCPMPCSRLRSSPVLVSGQRESENADPSNIFKNLLRPGVDNLQSYIIGQGRFCGQCQCWDGRGMFVSEGCIIVIRLEDRDV